MIRDLKIRSEDLDAVLNGRTAIELGESRTDVEIDDHLRLREWDPDTDRYLNREHVVLVTGVEERDGGRVLLVRDEPPETEGPVS